MEFSLKHAKINSPAIDDKTSILDFVEKIYFACPLKRYLKN